MEKLVRLIRELIDSKWYGSLEIKMEAGHIVIIKKIESIKLESLKWFVLFVIYIMKANIWCIKKTESIKL